MSSCKTKAKLYAFNIKQHRRNIQYQLFFLLLGQAPDRSNCSRSGSLLGHTSRMEFVRTGKVWWWQCRIALHSASKAQRQRRNECQCSALSHVIQSRIPARETMPPAASLGFHAQLNICGNTHTRRCVSMMILNPIQLTIKNNHHIFVSFFFKEELQGRPERQDQTIAKFPQANIKPHSSRSGIWVRWWHHPGSKVAWNIMASETSLGVGDSSVYMLLPLVE